MPQFVLKSGKRTHHITQATSLGHRITFCTYMNNQHRVCELAFNLQKCLYISNLILAVENDIARKIIEYKKEVKYVYNKIKN